jgi:hypothetical protein
MKCVYRPGAASNEPHDEFFLLLARQLRGAAAVIDVGLGHPIPQTRLRDPQLLGQLGWSSIDPDCRPARRQELDLRTRRGIGPVSAARPGRRRFGLAGPANVIHASARNSREVPGQEES